jgi:hypothetical protein
MSYTGQKGILDLTRLDSLNTTAPGTSQIFFTSDAMTTGAQCLGGVDTLITENAAGITIAAPSTLDAADIKDLYLHLPQYITSWNWKDRTNELANPVGIYYISDDISDSPTAAGPLKRGTIPPYNGASLITIHTSGVSNTAPIKMILRYGSEILLVSSSVYSPFKFMSPRYDESAIKSYARCIRSMKDAYFANAGSVIGQADYNNKLMNLVEHDVAGDLNRVLNQGGVWTAAVGAY